MINIKQMYVKSQHNRISWIDIQEIVFSHAAIVAFLLTVTLLTMIFHFPFKMKSQNTKVCLLKCLP